MGWSSWRGEGQLYEGGVWRRGGRERGCWWKEGRRRGMRWKGRWAEGKAKIGEAGEAARGTAVGGVFAEEGPAAGEGHPSIETR